MFQGYELPSCHNGRIRVHDSLFGKSFRNESNVRLLWREAKENLSLIRKNKLKLYLKHLFNANIYMTFSIFILTKMTHSGWNSNDSSHTIVYKSSLVGSKLSQLQSNGSSHSGSASSLCNPSKYGCFRAYFTVYLFSGLNISILPKRLSATGFALG